MGVNFHFGVEYPFKFIMGEIVTKDFVATLKGKLR